ncbi:MAG: hypothetical protein KJO60_02645 [Desulfofustis sp.]|nr:hypothetical protein [Desulfofustis sp.]
MRRTTNRLNGWLVIGLLSLSLILWLHGLLSSQIYDPEVYTPLRKSAALLRDNAAKHTEELELAKAYWLRYTDVRTHSFFGEEGPLGIAGAREHYLQHGRREGRIYERVAEVEDPEKERILAEAYWRRYPDIAVSRIWGRTSALGIRGPRDHYRYIGRQQKLTWGSPETVQGTTSKPTP